MIEVKDLHFTYQGNREQTIKGLEFRIKKGEVFGFLGPSGAGKSTTQKILLGILKGYSGSIEVFGRNLKELRSDYYERVGVSFEFPNLYSKLTARENLDFFASLYSGETEDPLKLLTMVGLEDSIDIRVSKFSKGMKMRLNFCRALLNNPEVLFLDEPTAGLDPANARRIKDIIFDLKRQGKTVFVTTHNMNVAEEVCDRIAFIVEGKLSLIDAPASMMMDRSRNIVRVEYGNNGRVGAEEFSLEKLGENSGFINLLKTQTIRTIHSQEADLEDIFIEVTGFSLTGKEE